MKILVDADACPVVSIVEHVASKYRIPVILLCDTNHVLQSAYSEVKVIGAGSDAVDFALVGLCQKGDLVVTQDYGVAAMILRKEAYGIHQSGKWYMDENIDRMLMVHRNSLHNSWLFQTSISYLYFLREDISQ